MVLRRWDCKKSAWVPLGQHTDSSAEEGCQGLVGDAMALVRTMLVVEGLEEPLHFAKEGALPPSGCTIC